MHLALPSNGGLLPWDRGGPSPRRVLSTWRVAVLCVGLVGTAAAAAATWVLLWPPTVVQTRIVADGGGAASRAALARAALGIGAGASRSATLDEGGASLVIEARDQDPAAAWRQLRSTTEALLNLPLPTESQPANPQPAARPSEERAGLLADRDRVLAAAAATDSRLTMLSASLTSVVRDIAAGIRSAAERKGGREAVDKGTALLADLQLQRIQLLTRYQNDYPAVVALEEQIRNLRSFLQEEGRRADAASRLPPADPADPTLAAERDRLRADLAQLTDRRTALGVELARINGALSSFSGPPAPHAEPAAAPPPTPVLIEAATTVVVGPDSRWMSISAVAATGLLLSMAAWFKPRRQPVPAAAEQLLLRLEALLLPHGGVATLPAGPSYPALTRPDLPMLLGTRPGIVHDAERRPA